MTEPIDVYTPWREDPATLTRRHVGREAERVVLTSSVREFVRGGRPLPLFFFGPPGVGKSHLLSLARTELQAELDGAGVALISIPEDIAALSTAAAVLERLGRFQRPPAWMLWGTDRTPVALPRRAVVFFEALDRHLEIMHEDERRTLRRVVDELDLYIVATGGAIGTAFTGRETAFYAAFQCHPLLPLDSAAAGTLLDKVAGDDATSRAEWAARRAAFVTLAGGSPRTLLALGNACATAPTVGAADHLHTILRQFTAHYQMRFRDLSPQGQAVVEVLASAPCELTPTELGRTLGYTASQASTVSNRLREEGVLTSRQEGRFTYFGLAEPLFRHWLEYQAAPWEQTRVGWLSRLIEAVLSPGDALITLSSRSQAERGLMALGLRHPERLEALLRGAVDPELRAQVERAQMLVRQMTPSHGHAQPELAHLRQILYAESYGSSAENAEGQ